MHEEINLYSSFVSLLGDSELEQRTNFYNYFLPKLQSIPKIGSAPIDIFPIFKAIIQHGGYYSVITSGKIFDIASNLQLQTNNNSNNVCVSLITYIYNNYLSELEKKLLQISNSNTRLMSLSNINNNTVINDTHEKHFKLVQSTQYRPVLTSNINYCDLQIINEPLTPAKLRYIIRGLCCRSYNDNDNDNICMKVLNYLFKVTSLHSNVNSLLLTNCKELTNCLLDLIEDNQISYILPALLIFRNLGYIPSNILTLSLPNGRFIHSIMKLISKYNIHQDRFLNDIRLLHMTSAAEILAEICNFIRLSDYSEEFIVKFVNLPLKWFTMNFRPLIINGIIFVANLLNNSTNHEYVSKFLDKYILRFLVYSLDPSEDLLIAIHSLTIVNLILQKCSEPLSTKLFHETDFYIRLISIFVRMDLKNKNQVNNDNLLLYFRSVTAIFFYIYTNFSDTKFLSNLSTFKLELLSSGINSNDKFIISTLQNIFSPKI